MKHMHHSQICAICWQVLIKVADKFAGYAIPFISGNPIRWNSLQFEVLPSSEAISQVAVIASSLKKMSLPGHEAPHHYSCSRCSPTILTHEQRFTMPSTRMEHAQLVKLKKLISKCILHNGIFIVGQDKHSHVNTSNQLRSNGTSELLLLFNSLFHNLCFCYYKATKF